MTRHYNALLFSCSPKVYPGQFGMENHPDAGFLCKIQPFPTRPVLITGFEPIVAKSPQDEDLGPDYVELIHHMNIFLCSSEIQDEIVPAEDEHRRHYCSTNK